MIKNRKQTSPSCGYVRTLLCLTSCHKVYNDRPDSREYCRFRRGFKDIGLIIGTPVGGRCRLFPTVLGGNHLVCVTPKSSQKQLSIGRHDPLPEQPSVSWSWGWFGWLLWNTCRSPLLPWVLTLCSCHVVWFFCSILTDTYTRWINLGEGVLLSNYLVDLNWNMCYKCLKEVLVTSGEKLDPTDKNERLRIDDGKTKSKSLTTGTSRYHYWCYPIDLVRSCNIPGLGVVVSWQRQVNDDTRLS